MLPWSCIRTSHIHSLNEFLPVYFQTVIGEDKPHRIKFLSVYCVFTSCFVRKIDTNNILAYFGDFWFVFLFFFVFVFFVLFFVFVCLFFVLCSIFVWFLFCFCLFVCFLYCVLFLFGFCFCFTFDWPVLLIFFFLILYLSLQIINVVVVLSYHGYIFILLS